MPFQPCLVRKGGTMRDVAEVVSYMRHISDAISVFFSAEQAKWRTYSCINFNFPTRLIIWDIGY